MSIQAIQFDPEDFDLFHGCFHLSSHLLECEDCRENAKRCPRDEQTIFGLLNEKLMVPLDVGDYEGMKRAAVNWFHIHSILGFTSETEH